MLLKFIKQILLILCAVYLIIALFSAPKKELHLVFASDNNYAIGLGITIMSILENTTSEEALHIYVLEKNISIENKRKIAELQKYHPFKIKYIHMNQYFKQNKHLPNYLNSPTFYRYFLADLFPDLPKILYLDSDLFAFSSLLPLWETDITHQYAAVVDDMHSTKYAPPGVSHTFNAGVMLVNLEEWRHNEIQNLLLETDLTLRKKHQYTQKDQTVLNTVFQDKIKWLNPRYNFFHTCSNGNRHGRECILNLNRYSAETIKQAHQHITLAHYVLQGKPWIFGPDIDYGDVWFHAVWKSPYHGIWTISNSSHTAKLLITDGQQRCYFWGTNQKGSFTFQNKTIFIQWDNGTKEVYEIIPKNQFFILKQQ